jgi:hypothetical protein
MKKLWKRHSAVWFCSSVRPKIRKPVQEECASIWVAALIVILLLTDTSELVLFYAAIAATLTILTQLNIISVVFQFVLFKTAILLQEIALGNGNGCMVQAQFNITISPEFFNSGSCAAISPKMRISEERKGIFALGDRPEPFPQRLGPQHDPHLVGPRNRGGTTLTSSAWDEALHDENVPGAAPHQRDLIADHQLSGGARAEGSAVDARTDDVGGEAGDSEFAARGAEKKATAGAGAVEEEAEAVATPAGNGEGVETVGAQDEERRRGPDEAKMEVAKFARGGREVVSRRHGRGGVKGHGGKGGTDLYLIMRFTIATPTRPR